MDYVRARQIVDSLGVIEVRYQNRPVWIEDLEDAEARVRFLDGSGRSRVAIAELCEV